MPLEVNLSSDECQEGSDPEYGRVILAFDCEWVKIEDARLREAEGREPLDLNPELGANHLLCYSYCVRQRGRECSGVVPTGGGRINLSTFVLAVIGEAVEQGVVATLEGCPPWPASIILAAHFSRADLPNFSDFSILKRKLDNAHGTYLTLGKECLEVPVPGVVRMSEDGERNLGWTIDAALMDTMLLSPAKASLSRLGDLIGVPKVDIKAAGFDIGRMDILFDEDRALFDRYAAQDSVITARYLDKVLDTQWIEGLDYQGRPASTNGSMALRYLGKELQWLKIKRDWLLGYTMEKDKKWLRKKGRFVTTYTKVPLPLNDLHRELATKCYHGGRNECFWFGPTPPGVWYEHDLTKAYTTTVALLWLPDYEAARVTLDPTDFRIDELGYARVRFQFPPETVHPCLAVRSRDQRGLVFPLEGETYTTSPEIVLALAMGAKIEVVHGVIVPWATGVGHTLGRPFLTTIQKLQDRSDAAKKAGDAFTAELYKEIANSLYGKFAQGLSGGKVFDTRTGEHKEMGAAWLTCPFYAAYITGLVRALMGELLHRIPPGRLVISATTDAIVTDAPLSEMDLTGPIARYFATGRALLGKSPEFLETKFAMAQYLSWRTRGGATVQELEGVDPSGKAWRAKIAKGGHKTPSNDAAAANEWIVSKFLGRVHGEVYTRETSPSFTEGYWDNLDFSHVEGEAKLSFECDWKRAAVDPHMEVALREVPVMHLAFGTRPWRNVEEFNVTRDCFERYKEHEQGCLKTVGDFERWEDYRAGRAASKAGVRRNGKGVVDQARRIILIACTRGLWGLNPGKNYPWAAIQLTKAGYPTTASDFKNARHRKGLPPENTISADAPGIAELIAAVMGIWPKFDAGRLVWQSGLSLTAPYEYSFPEVRPMAEISHFPEIHAPSSGELSATLFAQGLYLPSGATLANLR